VLVSVLGHESPQLDAYLTGNGPRLFESDSTIPEMANECLVLPEHFVERQLHCQAGKDMDHGQEHRHNNRRIRDAVSTS
jgi:hypothetical protein